MERRFFVSMPQVYALLSLHYHACLWLAITSASAAYHQSYAATITAAYLELSPMLIAH
jgi:hypothetical protein